MDEGILDSIIQILAIYLFFGPIKRYLSRIKKRIVEEDMPFMTFNEWFKFHFPMVYEKIHKHKH